MPGKSSEPARNRATATSSAAMSAAVAREPMPTCLAGDPEGREAGLVGGAERRARPRAARSGAAAGDGAPVRER